MPEYLRNESFSLAETDGVIREVLESGGEFEIYPRGTSMLPLIHQGRDSVVLIKPNGRLQRDDIALYLRKSGQYVLHRVISVEKDSYIMCGDNQITKEPSINDDMIIAKVARLTVNGKSIDLSDKNYIRYINRRRNLKLRRLLLFFEHRIGSRELFPASSVNGKKRD